MPPTWTVARFTSDAELRDRGVLQVIGTWIESRSAAGRVAKNAVVVPHFEMHAGSPFGRSQKNIAAMDPLPRSQIVSPRQLPQFSAVFAAKPVGLKVVGARGHHQLHLFARAMGYLADVVT